MTDGGLLTTTLLSNGLGVRHGFTSRLFGADCVSPQSADWSDVVLALHPEWAGRPVVRMDQVHGGDVVWVQSDDDVSNIGKYDAMVTTRSDCILAVRVADCVPLLLVAPNGVGVAHAGWRGVGHNIAAKTVQALCDIAACEPHEVSVAIGPHVCGRCYTVGPEVVEAIESTGVDATHFLSTDGDQIKVDLSAAIVVQLRAVGVVDWEKVGHCTRDSGLFSYRFDNKTAGRQFGLVGRE